MPYRDETGYSPRAQYEPSGGADQTQNVRSRRHARTNMPNAQGAPAHTHRARHASTNRVASSSQTRRHGAHTARPEASAYAPSRFDYVNSDEVFSDQSLSEGRVARAQARHEAKLRRRRQMYQRIAVALAVVLVLVVAGGALVRWRTSQRPSAPTSTSNPSTPTVVEEPTAPSESEQRIEEVRVRAAANCTREQPQSLTDPANYAELGRTTMENIAATCSSWESFDNAGDFTLDARYSYDGEIAPYLIAINRAANVVTVYTLDEDGRYTQPYMAMICSTGAVTPLGFYLTSERYNWLPLYQEVFGQYATRIVNDILFHSVPYYNPYMDDLEYEEYNKLGTAASMGCIRMQVCDVKWIFDNCPLGTPVVIYDDVRTPGPMGRPGTIATNVEDVDTTSASYRGFDPTDPNSANPWDVAFRSGTAIRSDAAQAEWDSAQADGRWNDSINPADLLGYSTDAASRG